MNFGRADLEERARWDTPTICNGLELLAPSRRALGFATEPMLAADRALNPMVGLARVGALRAKEPPGGPVADTLDWCD